MDPTGASRLPSLPPRPSLDLPGIGTVALPTLTVVTVIAVFTPSGGHVCTYCKTAGIPFMDSCHPLT